MFADGRYYVGGYKLATPQTIGVDEHAARDYPAMSRVVLRPLTPADEAVFLSAMHASQKLHRPWLYAPQTELEAVARMMTERRIRHAPVLTDGALSGIVSIGDVVKSRIGELEAERAALSDYIAGTPS